MFKNVANLVKFKNQLVESKKEAKRKAKKAAEAAKSATAQVGVQQELQESQTTQRCECEDYDHLAQLTSVTRAKDKNGNFILRQSRKRLSTMADRLRRVKTFTVLRKQKSTESDDDDDANDIDAHEKSKFVIDYEEQRLVRHYQQRDQCDCQSTFSDDAYVSACESFDDDLDNGDFGTPVGVQQAHRAVAPHYTSDQARDEKFVMPEERADIPTFLHTRDCPRELIDETRRLLAERYDKNPDSFFYDDYERMTRDDWTVSRFLLRRRLDPKRTAALMENCGKFRRQYLMGRVQRYEFPAEFHLAGGLFQYAPDRVGNTTMYMRIKMYRRVPEITELFKRLVLSTLEQCDTSTGGRGTAVVFDLTNAGLQNVDLGFLYWLLNSFRNYCPKGVSYILVLNLPWFLSATAKLAMTWMSATNRRSLRFVQGKEIENFIAPENLPDYLEGACQQDYRVVPAGSYPASTLRVGPNLELTREQANKIKELFRPWLPVNYEQELLGSLGEEQQSTSSENIHSEL